MKKVDRINQLLSQGLPASEVAVRVPASLSWVYDVRGRRGVSRLRHQVAVLQQEVAEIHQRLRLLEGKPVDIFDHLQRGA